MPSELAGDCQLIPLCRARGQAIARIDEREQRLELMIPILPPPPDMQREIYLGVGGFVQCQSATDAA